MSRSRSAGIPRQPARLHEEAKQTLLRIPSRFHGLPTAGHGGYTCGMVAALLGGAPAQVSLRCPPPLDRDLEVVQTNGPISVRDGDRLVAEGVRAELDLEPTDAVDPGQAADISRRGYDRWAADHPSPRCFVCGPERQPGDGLRLFPGPLGDGRFAVAWTPDAALADNHGRVKPQYVWAALDCPTVAPLIDSWRDGPLLAALHVRIDAPVTAGVPHAIVAWPLTVDGRKRRAACAIFDATGRPLALGRALWIEPRN
jgi:hypothetical protein